MAWTTVEGWPGRVWTDERGTKTFYIRQMRGGKRYQCSTRCHTLRAAMNELARFERDPANYRPAGSEGELLLTDALLERYEFWCRQDKNFDPEVSERWLQTKMSVLRWWQEKLAGRNLSVVRLEELHDHMAGLKNRKNQIATIKHLYTFLRESGKVKAAEDPTLKALPVPQSKPAQDTTGRTKVIPEDDFRKVLPLLPERIADACRVMAGTGIHLSEVIRFAQSGTVEDGELYGLPDGDVLCFRHKGGHIHRVQVSTAVSAAAERLKGWAVPGREAFYGAIKRACVAAGVEPWTPGRWRHTVATRSVQSGQDPAQVARSLGHTSPATTLEFYATTAIAPKVEGGIE